MSNGIDRHDPSYDREFLPVRTGRSVHVGPQVVFWPLHAPSDDHPSPMIPSYETEGASGMDIRAYLRASVSLHPGDRYVIGTGLCCAVPTGYELQCRSRSGLASRDGIMVLNSPGTIDSDYRGEIRVILYNTGIKRFGVSHGMRIAQLVLCPVMRAAIVLADSPRDATARGSGGFGSTGVE